MSLPSVRQIYKTPKDALDAYANSTCCKEYPDARNRFLIDTLAGFISQDNNDFARLDRDAKKVLGRSKDKINNPSTYEDVFNALADYLWVNASVRLCNEHVPKGVIHLIKKDHLIQNMGDKNPERIYAKRFCAG